MLRRPSPTRDHCAAPVARRSGLNRSPAPAPYQLLPKQPLRTNCQHQDHDQERQHGRVVLEVNQAELFGAADDDGAERSTRYRSHAANNDHLSATPAESANLRRARSIGRFRRRCRPFPPARRRRRIPGQRATAPGSREPTACRDRRPRHGSSTPIRVRWRASHMPIPMSDGGGENDEPHARILKKDGLAA